MLTPAVLKAEINGNSKKEESTKVQTRTTEKT